MSDEDSVDVGPAGDTIDELLTLLQLQQGLLSAVATGGPRIETVDRVYKERRARLRRGLNALGLIDPFPWSGLWDWYGVWSQYGGWAARRAHIEQLAGPIRDDLEARRDKRAVADWGEETVEGLEHRLAGLRSTLESARSLDDYQDVGRRAREILIDLARLAFDESMVPAGKSVPGPSDAKSRLEYFFGRRFAGEANEEMRRLMKAAVALANAVTHSDEAADVHAFAVAQATVLVVRVVAKLGGADVDWLRLSPGEANRAQGQAEEARKRRVDVVSTLRNELGRVPAQMAQRQDRSYPPFDRLVDALWRSLSDELRGLVDAELFRLVASAYDLLAVEIDLEGKWLAARAPGMGIDRVQGSFYANELKRHDRDLWRLACEACKAMDAALIADDAPRGPDMFCP